MKLSFKPLFLFVLIHILSFNVYGVELSGLWQEYDDDTGKPEAIIRIDKVGDIYEGTIERLLLKINSNTPQRCTKCEGELHNRPLLGLRILSGLNRKDTLFFEGGQIIDPDDGRIYRCEIKILDANSIKVTGYLGFHWLGESEIWRRLNAAGGQK
jgi:uncharacterized protein (DUF2147 family)